jgi:hypothetical protein
MILISFFKNTLNNKTHQIKAETKYCNWLIIQVYWELINVYKDGFY